MSHVVFEGFKEIEYKLAQDVRGAMVVADVDTVGLISKQRDAWLRQTKLIGNEQYE